MSRQRSQPASRARETGTRARRSTRRRLRAAVARGRGTRGLRRRWAPLGSRGRPSPARRARWRGKGGARGGARGAGTFRRAPRTSVERFDTELISKISAKSSNFRRLVLSCINADFCVQGLILQRFSKSTRLPHLCTARNSKPSQIFIKLFNMFAEISAKIAIFQQFSSNFASISMKFSQNFDE